MKKFTTFTFILSVAFHATAQNFVDTIEMEPGYAKQVFYRIASGNKHASALNQWHIAHTTVAMDNAIRLNHAAGVFAYLYPYGDNSAYNSFDTTGWANWVKPYNDMKDESLGALNQQKDPDNMWDFSWGVYDPSSHVVKGDSLYLITVGSGANMKFFKFMPVKQDKNGDFIFVFGPLDENQGTEDTIKSSKADKGMFKYFNFLSDAQVNIETPEGQWDLNFTRYYDLLPAPGTGILQMYPTTGVESKRGLRIAHAHGVEFADLVANPQAFLAVANADTSIAAGHGFNTGLTRVGGDWKFFNGNSFVITPRQNFLAAVSVPTGTEYWAIRFLSFEGQASGRITLERAKLGELANNENLNTVTMGMFPNPASEKLTVSLNRQAINVVRIFNLSGMLLKQCEADASVVDVDLSDLSAGQYILEAQHAQGSIKKLFLKN